MDWLVSLEEAARRETLEETGWSVELLGVVGIGLYTALAQCTQLVVNVQPLLVGVQLLVEAVKVWAA